jgi:sterol 3beta-glucosyltransferase
MHVVMTTVGTRGDVQPFVALGRALGARGHRVDLATHVDHESFVRGHGLGFRPIGGSFLALVQSELGRAWIESGDNLARYLKTTRAAFGSVLPTWYADSGRACEDADVVVTHPMVCGAFHVAEKRSVPLVCVSLYPVIASGELAPMTFPRMPAWGWLRRFVWNQASRGMSAIARPYLAAHRAELGLPPVRPKDEFREALLRGRVLHAYSGHLVPRPRDWPDNVQVTGFLTLPAAPDYLPPPGLEAFLRAGEPPIYVGFGSMTGRDPEELTRTTLDAIRRAKQRAVVVTGWGGIEPGRVQGEDVYLAREVPHDWLFPHVRAAVHHGGAGTTAASLRAGLPTLVVAFFGDQTFWGHHVGAVGAGPRPLQRRALDPVTLGEAIARTVACESYAKAARALGEKLRAEDGVGAAVARVEAHAAGG